jgi:hypothetical protein
MRIVSERDWLEGCSRDSVGRLGARDTTEEEMHTKLKGQTGAGLIPLLNQQLADLIAERGEESSDLVAERLVTQISRTLDKDLWFLEARSF